jgi:hypothetical protein
MPRATQYPSQTNEYKRARYAADPEFRAKCNANAKASVLKNPEKYRAYHAAKSRRKTTGWTQEEFDAAKAKQCGRCAVCEREPNGKGLQADHCHKTGKKRALLCTRCNLTLGKLENEPELIAKLMAYLEEHQCRH